MNLNDEIQGCKNCYLHNLEYNKYDLSRGYGKLLGNGGKEIFIVAQNPSTIRCPGLKYAMGIDHEIKKPGKNLSLKKIFSDLKIDMNKIYWTNVVKCSVDRNIPPSKNIIDTCGEWLLKEIDLIKPKKIIAMGKIPYTYLLSKELDIPVSYIWHYAFVSRNFDSLINKYKLIIKSELKEITYA